MPIAENYRTLVQEVKPACLVAVTKGRSIEDIMALYLAGCRDFGENRVQEALEKMEQSPRDIRWHFVGKLQKNKVNKVIGRFYLIHSVDTPELAEKISNISLSVGIKTPILLEANTSGEVSKSGLSAEQWKAVFPKIEEFEGLDILGLMTMAPLTQDEEMIHSTFAKLRRLGEEVGKRELSMGMSRDYQIAVQEGATLVRIGSALFET